MKMSYSPVRLLKQPVVYKPGYSLTAMQQIKNLKHWKYETLQLAFKIQLAYPKQSHCMQVQQTVMENILLSLSPPPPLCSIYITFINLHSLHEGSISSATALS